MRIKLSVPLCLDQVADCVSGINLSRTNSIIEYISTDSREVKLGDLFIALKGERFDGHDFLTEVKRKGAHSLSMTQDNTSILVKDTSDALLLLASAYKSMLPCLKKTVAITGSVGKTTTKNFLNTLLRNFKNTHATQKNLNNLIGVPLTVLSSDKLCEVLIVECGMNHTGELSKISRAICPDIAIITRIGSSHIGNFGSREMIARAKSEIASSETVRCLIVPHTEPLLKDKENRKSLVISKNENLYSDAFYRLVIKDISSNGCVGQFIDSQGEFNFNASINGQHNLECLGFAIAAARECGLSHDEIRSAIEDNSEWEVRGNNVRFSDFTVFDDSYNSSPESVIADLDMLKLRSRNKLSVALGDIYELGSFTEKIHRQLGYTVAKKGVNKMYLFGVYSQFIKEGALLCGMDSKRIFTNSDLSRPEITAEQIFLNHEKNEAILLKASHAVNMGAIIQHLKYLENKK